ncbi:MAG: AraC family transcriptional regulator [Cyanobacteriota bacterium]|nr:AraC family transcriptional regulator [Cyanobacteriota bacterium]
MDSNSIAIYNSMAEFYAALGGSLEQEVEFTIHRLEQVHGDIPIQSPRFRANYYSIIIISEGRGKYFINNHSYATKPFTIYFTNPGHVKGFEIYELTTGFVITFAESFLKQYVRENIFDEFPFLIAELAPPQYPNQEKFQEFNDLGNQIINEYESKSAYKFKIIGSLMVVLLLKIKEKFWQTYNPINESDSGSQIVINFKRNLEKHFRDLTLGNVDTLYQVQDYAQAQHLHPSYLSTVIKSKTGKSVNNWITEKLVAESKAFLSLSSVPVQEIAYKLGFKEPSHFSRFFKKHTGISPSAFRENT